MGSWVPLEPALLDEAVVVWWLVKLCEPPRRSEKLWLDELVVPEVSQFSPIALNRVIASCAHRTIMDYNTARHTTRPNTTHDTRGGKAYEEGGPDGGIGMPGVLHQLLVLRRRGFEKALFVGHGRPRPVPDHRHRHRCRPVRRNLSHTTHTTHTTRHTTRTSCRDRVAAG